MRTIASLFVLVALACTNSVAQHDHEQAAPGGNYGSVNFRTSCAPAVQAQFARTVAMLHSFVYEGARSSFTEIAQKDPQCAIAWWGVAMTHYRGLWEQMEFEQGKAAVEKARAAAKSSKVTNRERAYIEAIAQIYRNPAEPLHARELAYEGAMAKLHADYPDDNEATIFYALALDVTAPKDDRTYANQRKARDLLTPLFQQQPNHPGLAHYIIHVSDFPGLADGALDAARRYAKIAPDSAHALHMPSHIFTRLGLWDESIASNRASAASAERNRKAATTSEAYNQRLHALDYLEYAYLQLGRVDEARAIAEEAQRIWGEGGLINTGSYAQAAIPARYAVERQDWKAAAALEPRVTSPAEGAITWYAKGLGAAMTGDDAGAITSLAKLTEARDALKSKDAYWSQQVEIQRLQVQAWRDFQGGAKEEGLQMARAAADLEDSLMKSPVTPGPVMPAREGLARMLMAAGKTQEAEQEFNAVLKTSPNRRNALAGLRETKSATTAAK